MTEQLNFQFFWPLTEQIPLDLDYTNCEKPKLSVSYEYTNILNVSGNLLKNSTLSVANISLDVDTTVIKSNTKPPLIRRGLYKLLGLKWEIK